MGLRLRKAGAGAVLKVGKLRMQEGATTRDLGQEGLERSRQEGETRELDQERFESWGQEEMEAVLGCREGRGYLGLKLPPLTGLLPGNPSS